jgi:hypothetical protein
MFAEEEVVSRFNFRNLESNDLLFLLLPVSRSVYYN